MSYNTFTTYSGDGSTTDFSVPFPYLRQEDVIVTRKNGPVSFTFVNPSLIRLTDALESDDFIYVERKTAVDSPQVVYSNGSAFTAGNINATVNQLLYAIQETYDRTGTVYGRSYTISSFDSLFNDSTTTFRLDSGGINLGDIINSAGLWVVSLNGVLLENTVDFSVAVNSEDQAEITFANAPKTGDNANLTFIRFYDGNTSGVVVTNGELNDLADVAITNPQLNESLVYDGTKWVNNSVSGGGGGSSPSSAFVEVVTQNPASGTVDGETIYNSTDGKLYIWDADTSTWLDIFQEFTPDAPDAITVVSSLPASGTAGQVVYLSTDEKLYEWDAAGSQWVAIVLTNDTSATVADGSITTAKFAQGITPVEIVASLPSTSNFEGRMAYLTTDNKLYRYEGAAWTSAVAGGDLTGSVDGSLLTANSIAAGVIQAGAISATEIATGAISTDKLAASSITSEKIASLSVTALKIATDAITSDKLQANSVVVGKVAAGAIGASQIQSGTITTSHLSANNFLLGSGYIADAAITTAKIYDANVTTLKVQGEAIVIPRNVFDQNAYSGTNSWRTVGTITFTLPYQAKCFFIFGSNQAYSGSIPDTTLEMYLNGSVISGVSNGGGYPSNSPSLSGGSTLSAGTHTVYVRWKGATSSVVIGNTSLSVIGAMR